jgi:Holliday junction DNA helicase RuvA
MLYHIEGTITELEPGLAVLDCGGIGFGLNVTMNTLSELRLGEKTRLFVSEAIGETNFDLYGFKTKSERRCFEMLLSVSGIGPKAALSILSHNSPESLALAIMSGDEKALTVAPGIGKRIAQRVILELKDKIGKEMGELSFTAPAASVPAAAAAGENKAVSDALAGLAVLGYSSAELTPVLKTMDLTGMDAQTIIKQVLKQMVR